MLNLCWFQIIVKFTEAAKVKKGVNYGIARDITEDLPPQVAAFEVS